MRGTPTPAQDHVTDITSWPQTDKQSNRGRRESRELAKERRIRYSIAVTSLALTCSPFNSTPASILTLMLVRMRSVRRTHSG